jgi:hypothetical protein
LCQQAAAGWRWRGEDMQVRDAAGKAERQKMRCMHAYITDIVSSMILTGTLYRFTSPPSQKDVRIAVIDIRKP